MCAQCAIVAAAAASGTRSWLAAHGFGWMTPRRLKAATAILLAAGLLGSTVTVSGSTPAPASRGPAHVTAR
jgi:hypothetical protein